MSLDASVMTHWYTGEAVPYIQTVFGEVRICPETWSQLPKELNRTTKAGRALRQFELDVASIAEVEWLHGDRLTEI